jgi:predicted nucleic acid-binding protein
MELSKADYLFDTTVFVDYLQKRSIAQKIFKQIPVKNLLVGYSIVTEAELWAGIKPPRTVEEHVIILKPFKRMNINVAIARRAGELRSHIATQKWQRIPGIVDCLIAATAEYYGLTICSRNSRDFAIFTNYSIKVVQYTL